MFISINLTLAHSFTDVLAAGVVILISIAIAAGVVFLLVLLGILWTLFSRRDSNTLDYSAYEDEDDDSTHQRPSSLLEHINAATRTAIIGGAASPFDDTKNEKAAEGLAPTEPDVFAAQDGDNFVRAETPSDALHGTSQGRVARARYSFDGKAEGELPLNEGMSLEILDDRDQNWWYARDLQTGQEGVVPASYVL